MTRALFLFFVVGLVLTVLGWFFDRALEFRWLVAMILPEYFRATEVLDKLEQNDHNTILATHPGMGALLERWPELDRKAEVQKIGRSVAFMEFGSSVGSDIELIARAAENEEVPPRWRMSSARKLLRDEAERRVFCVGSGVFFLGVLISAASGLIEFLRRD